MFRLTNKDVSCVRFYEGDVCEREPTVERQRNGGAGGRCPVWFVVAQ